jgi:hypothetical protein
MYAFCIPDAFPGRAREALPPTSSQCSALNLESSTACPAHSRRANCRSLNPFLSYSSLTISSKSFILIFLQKTGRGWGASSPRYLRASASPRYPFSFFPAVGDPHKTLQAQSLLAATAKTLYTQGYGSTSKPFNLQTFQPSNASRIRSFCHPAASATLFVSCASAHFPSPRGGGYPGGDSSSIYSLLTTHYSLLTTHSKTTAHRTRPSHGSRSTFNPARKQGRRNIRTQSWTYSTRNHLRGRFGRGGLGPLFR